MGAALSCQRVFYLEDDEPEVWNRNLSHSSLSPKGAAVMRNELILEKIAKHLPMDTLLHVRPTCSQWKHAFEPTLMKRKLISLGQSPGAVLKFNNLVRHGSDMPFRFTKYEIGNITSVGDHLFSVRGRHITELTLYLRPVPIEADLARRLIFHCTPELRVLTLDAYKWTEEGQLPPGKVIPNLKQVNLHGGIEGLLPDLIRFAVGLESISLAPCSFPGNSGHAQPALLVLREMNSLHKLKALNLGDKLDQAELELLIALAKQPENRLRLEKLVAAGNQNYNLLHTLLVSQAGSLRELDISLKMNSESVEFQVPKMERLEVFRFHRRWCQTTRYEDRRSIKFEECSLGRTFPHLKRVEFDVQDIVLGDYWDFTHSGVTELAWDAPKYEGCLPLKFLGEQFRAVTRVELSLSPSCYTKTNLRAFWTTWPALESLYLKHTGAASWRPLNLDELLSGVPKTEIEGLKRQLGRRRPTLSNLKSLQQKYKREPGISDLKPLQSLTFELEHGSENATLTDVGGYLGLAFACPGLQLFRIKAPKFEGEPQKPWFSNECQVLIKAALGPLAVIDV